jgi:CHAT domain-containing protein
VLRGDIKKNGKMLAFGNPRPGPREYALPGAQREIDEIRQYFPQQEAYFQKEATKRRLVASAPAANLLHIAAHAEVDVLDPLYSRILLAPEGKDQGRMEARGDLCARSPEIRGW